MDSAEIYGYTPRDFEGDARKVLDEAIEYALANMLAGAQRRVSASRAPEQLRLI